MSSGLTNVLCLGVASVVAEECAGVRNDLASEDLNGKRSDVSAALTWFRSHWTPLAVASLTVFVHSGAWDSMALASGVHTLTPFATHC